MTSSLITLCISIFISIFATNTSAKEFAWSEQSDIIGEQKIVIAKYEDTLSDIGQSNNIGFNEIVNANPELDAWLPGDGSQVMVPSEYILPSTRKGIVINLREFRLYYFPKEGGRVVTYPVGIGAQETPSPLIESQVKLKIEKPNWYPPESIKAEYLKEHGEEMSAIFPPGPDNPLGAFAIQLDIPDYFLHGTNKAFGIGTKVSHGCIRLYNEDIENLVYQLPKKTPVIFIKEPIKLGMKHDELFVELHPDKADNLSNAKMVELIIKKAIQLEKRQGPINLDIDAIESAVQKPLGSPQRIGTKYQDIKKADVVAVSPLSSNINY